MNAVRPSWRPLVLCPALPAKTKICCCSEPLEFERVLESRECPSHCVASDKSHRWSEILYHICFEERKRILALSLPVLNQSIWGSSQCGQRIPTTAVGLTGAGQVPLLGPGLCKSRCPPPSHPWHSGVEWVGCAGSGVRQSWVHDCDLGQATSCHQASVYSPARC